MLSNHTTQRDKKTYEKGHAAGARDNGGRGWEFVMQGRDLGKIMEKLCKC